MNFASIASLRSSICSTTSKASFLAGTAILYCSGRKRIHCCLPHQPCRFDSTSASPNFHQEDSRRMGKNKQGVTKKSSSSQIENNGTSNDIDISLEKLSFSFPNEPKKEIGRELNFVSRLSPTTGKMEWVELPEDYDYHQEIARSAYADMLHDHDRNIRYFDALRYEINLMKSKGEPAHVLDIGTGTGLLSMMAVVAGADSVFACDAFSPMLDCARKVVKRNGFEDKIKLIPKRSTELKVGVDLPYRCNILVTEVFDTELIGEGAISTFNHAHKELLTETSVVIPGKSTVYAQVVHSKEVEKWNSLPNDLPISNFKVNFPGSISSCSGVPSVQDLQLDAIKSSEFITLSPPIPIFSFDFTTPTPIPEYRNSEINFKSEAGAQANAVFMWWDLDMDTSGENVLSCQPSYVKQGPANWFDKCAPHNAAWRDHWMHSVYYIPRSDLLKTGESGTLFSAHDEYSFWFDIIKESKKESVQFLEQHPICDCGVHTTISRSQIYLMNDSKRYEKFVDCYKDLVVPGKTVCMCISDCSILPVILCKLGAKRVIVVESCRENERITREVFKSNQVDDRIEIIQNEEIDKLLALKLGEEKIDLVTGDPYFQMVVYPWNNLRYWYLLKSLSPTVLSPSVKLAPWKAVFRGMAVDFTHLWKIRAPVNLAAHKFDLKDFDDLIKRSAELSDSEIDAQPLWEYESIATSDPKTILEFDLNKDPENRTTEGELIVAKEYIGRTNGVVVWMDWVLPNQVTLSTGPKIPTEIGKPITWERFSKQGVFFLNEDLITDKIGYKITFDSETADFIKVVYY